MDKQAYHYNKKKLKGRNLKARQQEHIAIFTLVTQTTILISGWKINPMPRLKLQSANGRFYILWTKQSITITTPIHASLHRLFTAKMKKNSHPNSDKRE